LDVYASHSTSLALRDLDPSSELSGPLPFTTHALRFTVLEFFEEHDEGVEEVIGEGLQGAAG